MVIFTSTAVAVSEDFNSINEAAYITGATVSSDVSETPTPVYYNTSTNEWIKASSMTPQAIYVPTVVSLDASEFTTDSVNKVFTGESTNDVRDIHFGSDGSSLFICVLNDLKRYSLSTPWDLSTISTNAVTTRDFSTPIGTTLYSVYFKPDGSTLYLGGTDIYEFSLGIDWNITIGSTGGTYDNMIALSGTIGGIEFSADGKTLIFVDYSETNRLRQYTLSSAWDISTATFDTSVDIENIVDVFFDISGKSMFVVNSTSDSIIQYALSRAWDISDITLGESIDVSGTTIYLASACFGNYDNKVYFTEGTGTAELFQYSTNKVINSYIYFSGKVNEFSGLSAPENYYMTETAEFTIDSDSAYNHTQLGRSMSSSEFIVDIDTLGTAVPKKKT
jgi:hypothetical protein